MGGRTVFCVAQVGFQKAYSLDGFRPRTSVKGVLEWFRPRLVDRGELQEISTKDDLSLPHSVNIEDSYARKAATGAHLNAAEGLVVAADGSAEVIQGVEEVCGHHRYWSVSRLNEGGRASYDFTHFRR